MEKERSQHQRRDGLQLYDSRDDERGQRGAVLCFATNGAGSAASNSATLTVNTPVTITSQPVSLTVTAGQTATFSVSASGAFSMTYQWRKNGVNISGATAASYTTPATATADNGAQFSVAITSVAGSVTSNSATLTVTSAPVGPSITTQPASRTVTAGQTAAFSVIAGGTSPLSYQWRKNGASIGGATASSYTTPSDHGCRQRRAILGCGHQFRWERDQQRSDSHREYTGEHYRPASQPGKVTAGQTATFSVTATGTAPLSYQWTRNDVNIGGATASIYTTPATTVAGDNGAQFAVVAVNPAGSATSSSATLTVTPAPVAPSITTQPANQTVAAGQTASFSVVASGTAPLSYQWSRNGGTISGATGTSYTTPATTTGDSGALFSVVVTNSLGSATSSAATLTVNTPVNITSQPVGQSVTAGQTAAFSITATGTGPMSYQWRKNGANISGATASSYTTPATTAADNGAQYSVVVTNSVGSVTSNAVTLTVNAPPSITAQPASLTVVAGQTATFSVTATGTGPLSYQWLKNGVNIGAATGTSYTTPATTTADTGARFTVVVSNSVGSATSTAATLTVNAATLLLSANPSSLSFGSVNLSSSKMLAVTISNTGNSSVTVGSVSQSGPGFSAGGVSSGSIIAAGQTATLNVTFVPSSAGQCHRQRGHLEQCHKLTRERHIDGFGCAAGAALGDAELERQHVNRRGILRVSRNGFRRALHEAVHVKHGVYDRYGFDRPIGAHVCLCRHGGGFKRYGEQLFQRRERDDSLAANRLPRTMGPRTGVPAGILNSSSIVTLCVLSTTPIPHSKI